MKELLEKEQSREKKLRQIGKITDWLRKNTAERRKNNQTQREKSWDNKIEKYEEEKKHERKKYEKEQT